MKNTINIFLLILFVTSANIIKAQDINWDLKRNIHGITIHTRKIEKTGNVEFKASMITNTTIDTILNTAANVESYTQWMSDVIVSKTLHDVNKKERYIYIETKVPWPLKNRDMPFYQKIIVSNKTVKIILTGIPDYIPHKKGITRITKELSGSWVFTPIGDNKVKVIYKSLFYPGPTMPDWILGLFTVEGPYKTLIKLRAILEL